MLANADWQSLTIGSKQSMTQHTEIAIAAEAMRQLETKINYLPNAYRCAIEILGASGERTVERLTDLCGAYAKTYGLPADQAHADYTESAIRICERRYGMVRP
jgi:hypothetical protein